MEIYVFSFVVLLVLLFGFFIYRFFKNKSNEDAESINTLKVTSAKENHPHVSTERSNLTVNKSRPIVRTEPVIIDKPVV